MNVPQLLRRFGWGKRSASSVERLRRHSRLPCERLEDRTLLTADLVAFRPVTEFIDYSKYPVSEMVEEDSKAGPGIRVNGDDDNANDKADYLDTSTSATGDNDLVRVDAKGSSEGILSLSWVGNLAVWTTPTKQARVTPGTAVAPDQSVWVEYVNLTIHTTGDAAK